MSASYEAEWRARFGDDAGLAQEVPEVPWLRQVLIRRTHRRYADRPVPGPLLRLLLAAAFSASSKSDFQQASVIRVEERARRDRLAALVPDMPWIGTAPVFLVFCGDARRLERIGELRGHKADSGKLEGFFNAAIDAALVLQTFTLAAETAGLGCCPISALRNHPDAVAAVTPMTSGAMRGTRSRESSNARRRFSGTPRFTAGRKTRRVKPQRPRDGAFRPTCAPAASASISSTGARCPGSCAPEDYISPAAGD